VPTGDEADLNVNLSLNTIMFMKDIRQVGYALEHLASTFRTAGYAMSAAVTAPIIGVGTAALTTAGQFEQTEIAFSKMLGSMEKGKAQMEWMKNFAMTTPFNFEDVAQAERQMLAYGFSIETANKMMVNLTDAVAAMGKGGATIDAVTRALGQMHAKGRVTAEEMRQLSETGLSAWQWLADYLKTDVAGAMEMVTKREVTAEQGIAAFMAGVSGGRFAGAAQELNDTFLGQMSNLHDKIQFLLADIGKALLPISRDILKNFVFPLIDKIRGLTEAFQNLSPAMQKAVLIAAGMAAAIGPSLIALSYLLQMVGGGIASYSVLKTALTYGVGNTMPGALATSQLGTLGVAGAAATGTGTGVPAMFGLPSKEAKAIQAEAAKVAKSEFVATAKASSKISTADMATALGIPLMYGNAPTKYNAKAGRYINSLGQFVASPENAAEAAMLLGIKDMRPGSAASIAAKMANNVPVELKKPGLLSRIGGKIGGATVLHNAQTGAALSLASVVGGLPIIGKNGAARKAAGGIAGAAGAAGNIGGGLLGMLGKAPGMGLAGGIAGALGGIAMFVGPIAAVAAALGGIAVAFKAAYDVSEPLRNSISTLMASLGKLGDTVMNTIFGGKGGMADGMKNLQKVMDDIGKVAAPIFTDLVNNANNFVRALTDNFPAIWKVISDIAGALAGGLLWTFKALSPLIDAIGNALGEIWKGIGPPLKEMADQLLPVIMDLLGDLWELFQVIFPYVVSFGVILVNDMWPKVKFVFDQIIDTVKFVGRVVGDVIGIIVDLLTGDFSGAWDHFKDIFGAIGTFISDTLGNVVTLFADMCKGVSDQTYDLFVGVYNAAIGPLNSLIRAVNAATGSSIAELDKMRTSAELAAEAYNKATAARNAYNNAQNAVQDIMNGSATITTTAPYTGVGGVSITTPQYWGVTAPTVSAPLIKDSATGLYYGTYSGRAMGGDVYANVPTIVGERGPELFTPGVSGRITPNNALAGNITVVMQLDGTEIARKTAPITAGMIRMRQGVR
jgi:tape measure domain-containing protein